MEKRIENIIDFTLLRFNDNLCNKIYVEEELHCIFFKNEDNRKEVSINELKRKFALQINEFLKLNPKEILIYKSELDNSIEFDNIEIFKEIYELEDFEMHIINDIKIYIYID